MRQQMRTSVHGLYVRKCNDEGPLALARRRMYHLIRTRTTSEYKMPRIMNTYDQPSIGNIQISRLMALFLYVRTCVLIVSRACAASCTASIHFQCDLGWAPNRSNLIKICGCRQTGSNATVGGSCVRRAAQQDVRKQRTNS